MVPALVRLRIRSGDAIWRTQAPCDGPCAAARRSALAGVAGLLLSSSRRWLAGASISLLGLALLWFLSCNAVAIGLAQSLLLQVTPLAPQQLQAGPVQAIVVLGGGVVPQAPEYGQAQPSAHTLARLRYGAWLARKSGKPLAFACDVGWSAQGTSSAPEGEAARRVAIEDYGLELRWVDERSRDTSENVRQLCTLMQLEWKFFRQHADQRLGRNYVSKLAR